MTHLERRDSVMPNATDVGPYELDSYGRRPV